MAVGKHVNKYELIGSVGKVEPIRTLDSGSKVCKMSIVTEEGYFPKGSSEFKKDPQWHYLEGWDKTAEKMDKAVPGNLVYAEGSFRTQVGKDEKIYPKMKVYSFAILCDHGGKGSGSTGNTSSQVVPQPAPQVKAPPTPPVEDILF
jgi:single-strand DNA-binding protein